MLSCLARLLVRYYREINSNKFPARRDETRRDWPRAPRTRAGRRWTMDSQATGSRRVASEWSRLRRPNCVGGGAESQSAGCREIGQSKGVRRRSGRPAALTALAKVSHSLDRSSRANDNRQMGCRLAGKLSVSPSRLSLGSIERIILFGCHSGRLALEGSLLKL